MAASVDAEPAPTYGNWRRPTSAGIYGLGAIGTALLIVGMIFAVITMVATSWLHALVFAVVWLAGLSLLVFRDKHHRTVLQRAGVRVGWARTRRVGSHLYRSGPTGRTAWGTHQLPGLLAGTQLSEWTDSYGRPFALVRMPSRGTYTVVLGCEPDGAGLVDDDQVDTWVARWGDWLTSLGKEPGLLACSVSVETAPDTGVRLRREVDGRVVDDAPDLARAMLNEVVGSYPVGSAAVTVRVALTFNSSTPSGTRRSLDDVARNLGSRLPGFVHSLSKTGAGATRPMSAQELCEAIRIAYDPASAIVIDDAYADGAVPEISWLDVGPTAAETAWGHYRHDSAVSVTYAMSQAPRGEVFSSVLTDLLGPHASIARKRVTLLYRPIDSGTAGRIVEADKRSASFRATASDRPAARAVTDLRAAEQTAREESQGAGLVNFGALVTATVPDPGQLEDALATVDNLSTSSKVLLRRVYGSQDSAFAAGLPLGVVLPMHLAVPAEVRSML